MINVLRIRYIQIADLQAMHRLDSSLEVDVQDNTGVNVISSDFVLLGVQENLDSGIAKILFQ